MVLIAPCGGRGNVNAPHLDNTIPRLEGRLMRCLITVSILLFSGLSLADDRADGMFGTRQITSLNVAQAREVSELPGEVLDLSGLKSIEQGVASELACWLGRPEPGIHMLVLKKRSVSMILGLTSINKNVAYELSCFSGDELELNGLTTLDKDSANELAYFSGKLILNGVKTLDKDSAHALSKFRGRAIELRGIESLDAETRSILVADSRIITRR